MKGDGDGAWLGSAPGVALIAQLPSSPSPPWPGTSESSPPHHHSNGARSGDQPPPSLQRAYGMSMGARGWWCPTASQDSTHRRGGCCPDCHSSPKQSLTGWQQPGPGRIQPSPLSPPNCHLRPLAGPAVPCPRRTTMTVNHHVLFLFSLDGLRAKFKRGWGQGKSQSWCEMPSQGEVGWEKKIIYRRREVSERRWGKEKGEI